MGWMFVPLTQYHGGGAAATIEPLKDHLPHYGQRLANLFGAGVQACYRGPRSTTRRDPRAGEEVGRLLQATPRDSRFRHHPSPPAPTAATSITSCTSTPP